MKTLKICLIIPSLHPGGMERVMSELAKHFVAKNSTECHLILYGIKRDVFYSIPDSIKIYRPNFEFDNSKRFLHTIRTLLFVRRQIKEISPDTILSFGEYWNNLVLLALFGLNFPVFVSDRCQPDKSLGKFHDLLRKLLYPKAAGVIAQTQKAKETYAKFFNHSNVRVIGNPIRPIRHQDEIMKENIVLSVGRLIKSKHHDLLIKMFVKCNRKDWKLVIVGDDALKQTNMMKLKALVSELGAEENVILAGKHSDVEQYYNKSKIFAFTSSSEGFPNVIGEALASGLPVVCFDCVAGPSDLVKYGQNGFLVPLFDEGTFVEKLQLLMTDQPLREALGAKGKIMSEQFSLEKIGDEYYSFISPASLKVLE